MEGAHRKLCSRFTDRLRGNDTNRLSLLYERRPTKIDTIAPLTHPATRPARHHTTNMHFLYASTFNLLCLHFGNKLALLDENLSGLCLDLFERNTTLNARRKGQPDTLAVFAVERCPFGITAVRFANNHVLRHIDESTRQVSGCCRTQRDIRHTLSRAMR